MTDKDKNEFNFNLDPVPESTKKSLFNPTAEALGKAGGGIASFISIPFRNLGIWSEQKISNFEEKVIEKNQSIPEENRDFTKFQYTSKAIDDSKFSLSEESLQELFVNLISSTLDDRKNSDIHPSFSTILKEFSPFDAELFESLYISQATPTISIRLQNKNTFHGIDVEENIILFADEIVKASKELNSLQRSGLIDIHTQSTLVAPNYTARYEEFKESELYKRYSEEAENKTRSNSSTVLNDISLRQGHITLTEIGESFGDVVIGKSARNAVKITFD